MHTPAEREFVLHPVRERRNEKVPHYTGVITIEGKTYRLRAYQRIDRLGRPYCKGFVHDPVTGEEQLSLGF